MTNTPIIIQSSKFKIFSIIIGFIIVVVILGVLAWFVKSMRDENVRLRSEVTEQKKLTETLIRSSTHWATKKDLDASLKDIFSKEDYKALKKDMNSLNAKMLAVGKTIGSVKEKIALLEKSDHQGKPNVVEKCDDGRIVDVHEYTKNAQVKDLKDINNAPVGVITFNAAKKKPWSYRIYKHDYYIATVVGRRSSGQLTFHHTLKYKIPGQSDKLYPINLTSSKYIQLPESNKFFWWNPKLDLGLFVGGMVFSMGDGPGRNSLFSFGGELGFSFSSYGTTRIDSLWRFFKIGVGYDASRQAARFSLTPVLFNLGKPLPILTNLYIAPQVGFDTGGGLTISFGLSLQL